MSYPKYILNSLCFTATRNPYTYFKENILRARYIQLRVLMNLIDANRGSAFGKRFGFTGINGVRAYRAAVPVMTYDDYRPWIDRITAGEQGVLTTEKVHLLQPTGGSSGGSKLIPYTRRLQHEFRSGILAWWHDLYRRYPELRRGRAYWSITPAGQTMSKSGQVPIGFAQDDEYFGWRGVLLGGTFAVPPPVAAVRHLENFKYLTAYFLLKCADLSLISVWNPTFLILLTRDIEHYYDQIVADISDGDITLPAAEDISRLRHYFRADRTRAAELKARRTTDGQQDFGQIWQRLKLISCWRDASAAEYAAQLQRLFPRITIQGKGLLATEAIITLPWTAAGGQIPAYCGHFLEFISESEGRSCLIHELKMGETYKTVVTTGGGLYRYDIGDRVRVTGHALGLPLLTFIGRDRVVDLVGEKLEESHVQSAITGTLSRMRMAIRFVMLAPQQEEGRGHYVLYIEPEDAGQDSLLRQARVLIDTALKDNMQYAYARNIGQLSPLRIFLIRSGGHRGYYQRCLSEGQRMGDIKPVVLDRRPDWISYFEGGFLEAEVVPESALERNREAV